MEEYDSRAIKTIPISSQKKYKNRTDPRFEIDVELNHSNSANNLLDLKEEKKTKTERVKKKHLPRTLSAKSYFDHYNINNCEHCKGIKNMLKKDKSKLSSFIQENSYFLKLFGNPRYDRNSPFLFVEDHKNNIDDNKIGLLPIPSKPKLIMKSKEEKNNLYEIQRKIVMMRRFQYGKTFNEMGKIYDGDDERFFGKISQIQIWWKNIYKIIYIQKMFRGFRIRERMKFIINFIDIIKKFQRLLDDIKIRRILRYLVSNGAKKVPNKNNLKGYDFMSKIRRKGKIYLNNSNYNTINLYNKKNIYKDYINKGNKENPSILNISKKEEEKNIKNSQQNKYINGDDLIKNMNDLNKIISKRSTKNKIANNISLLTKEYLDKKNAIEKIDRIGNIVKDYLRYKNNIKRKNIKEENNNSQDNGLFIDKIYIPKSIQINNFNDKICNIKNKSENIYKPDEDKEKDKNNPKNEAMMIDKNKNIINSNDLIFKGKNCYIEKIRRSKKIFEDNKTKSKTDENNKNLSNSNSKYKNRNNKNDNIEKNKDNDDLSVNPLYNKNKYEEINSNKIDKYNIKKSINMKLDISKPENFQIINSQKNKRTLELSNKNNFSYNNSNRLSPSNRNLINEEEKNNGDKSTNKDKNKPSNIPLKKYILGNHNCFITKIMKIKEIGNEINNLKKDNKLNNIEIDYIESIYYNGNNNPKLEKGKKTRYQINSIGKNKSKDKDDKNDLVIDPQPISRIKYEGLNKGDIIGNISNYLPCFKNLMPEKNDNINYLVKDANNKEKNNDEKKGKRYFYDLDIEKNNFQFNYQGDNNIKEKKYTPFYNNFNYQGKNNERDENKLGKKNKLEIEYNSNVEYLGKKVDKEYKTNELFMESKDIIYYDGKNKDYNSLLMDNSNINIEYINQDTKINDDKRMEKNISFKDKEKENRYNLETPNKNEELIIQSNKSFSILNNNKNMNNDNKNKDLIIESAKFIKILGKNEKVEHNLNKGNIFDKNVIIYKGDNFSYKGKGVKIVNINNKNKKDEDKMNFYFKKPINGLLIKKLRLKNNIDKIKLIQDYFKNYLSRNKDNEKIYKKPLFNQFYYYETEYPYEQKSLKNKKKISDEEEENKNKSKNKINNEKNGISKDEKNKKDEDENSKEEDNNDKLKNENNNGNNEDYDGSTGPKYVERIIPNKKESRLYRLKHNHLLKIVKVQKGKSIMEKLIQCGKVVPNKPMSEEENKIENEYRSKTPENIKQYKKNYKEDVDNKGENDNKIKNKLKEGDKIDDLVKNYLSKSHNEDEIDDIDEKNNKKNEGNYTDYEDEILVNKRIKKLKNNMGNYFYMSKIRKGDINDLKNKSIKKIKDNKKDLDISKYNNNSIDDKNKDKEMDYKIRPYIINNLCYYEKIAVYNDTYEQFLNSQKIINDNKLPNNLKSNKIDNKQNNKINNNIIYKIPNDWKNNKTIYINNINKKNINFISKLRYIKYRESKKEDNKKEINDDENSKEDIIKKKENDKDNILESSKKYPCFVTKEIKKNDNKKDKDKSKLKENNRKIINNICFITKERKIHALSLSNKSYKKNQCLITKEFKIKNINLNNNLLSRKNFNFKNKNNNICFITKKRKLNIKKGIILPLKQIKFITKDRKKIVDNNTCILLPKKEVSFIDKIRVRENINQIKTIQNLYKLKINKEKENKNKLLYNNEQKSAFIPRTKFDFKDLDNSDFNEENLEKDNYYFNGYIDKIYKRKIYKFPKSNINYISKQSIILKKEKNKKNYSFLSLMDFFIKKNVQEYIYQKLLKKSNDNKNKILDTNYNLDTNNNPIDEDLNNEKKQYTYPKYYNNLKRIYNFYKTKKRGESPTAKKIYNEILPDLDNCKSLNDLLTKLNDDPNKQNKLINNKNKKIKEDDYIKEMGEFAKFDKNLSNGAFIKNKLKENGEINKDNNLFKAIKIIDEEYNNLINGKYCPKCGKEKKDCGCDDIDNLFKETEESKDNNKEDDDNLDFNDEEDSYKNKKINYFEYDSNKSKSIIISNKPKLSDYFSIPKNNLFIYNKKQLNEINQKIMGKENNINKFINSNNYSFNEGNSYQSNNSLSGSRYNNRYNNSINFNKDALKKSNKK